MYVEGKVGIQVLSDGVFTQPRLGKSGEVATSDCHAPRYEANYRGKLFTGSTAVAGVASQAAATIAAVAAYALLNPTGSGVNAVIHKAKLGLISGTTGVATYVWTKYAQGSTALGGTAVTPVSAQVGSAAVSACTAATGTSATGGTQTLVRGSCLSTGAIVGSTLVNGPSVAEENVDGDLIVIPGFALCLVAIGAAGTSEKNIYTLTWEEVPV